MGWIAGRSKTVIRCRCGSGMWEYNNSISHTLIARCENCNSYEEFNHNVGEFGYPSTIEECALSHKLARIGRRVAYNR